MVQHYQNKFDTSFSALGDKTRRGILFELAHGDKSVSDLAHKFGMTITGMKKHVAVLESADFIKTNKSGRTRICALGNYSFDEEVSLLENYRKIWAARFSALDNLLSQSGGKNE